jgi:hypothetical protein
MSSVEIKIKGVKSVKRGKPRAKRGKRKSKAGLLEKTKMAEYSFRGLPYNYVSPPQPTYIDRPAPPLLQQQQPSIDYKPIVDSLTQQLALARIKEQSGREQNMMPTVEEVGVPTRIDEPPPRDIRVGDIIPISRTKKVLKVVADIPKKPAVRKSATKAKEETKE